MQKSYFHQIPPLNEVHWDLDRVFLAFNKFAFIHDILMKDFNGDINAAAEAIHLPAHYLRDLLYNDNKQAGLKTLTMIYRFCVRTDRPPEKFIFLIQEIPPWSGKEKKNKDKEEGENLIWTSKNL